MKKYHANLICLFWLVLLFGCDVEQNNEGNNTPVEANNYSELIYLDAVEVASEHYKLLSENGSVRVVEMILPPGERDNMHSHMFETVYFLKGGHAKIYVDDSFNEVNIPNGYVLHHEPWTHSVENIGDDTIHAIIFERMEEYYDIPHLEDYIDATEASPDHYTLLSHEGPIRVVHMKLEPGQADEKHSH